MKDLCLFASLLLPFFSLSSAAQDATPSNSPTGFTLRAETRLVVLDVVVLDKQGKPVANLDRSQFTVLEDGVPQTIRSMEAHELSLTKNLPQIHSTEDLRASGSTRPVDLVVFDELNSKFEDMAYAREMLERYLKSQPEVLPVPMQMLAVGDAKLIVLHDYTQNRDALLEALRTHLPQYPWQMMRNQGGDGALERMAQSLGMMEQLADASNGTAGRKNVIWLGAGYPAINTTELGEEDQGKIAPLVQTVTTRMMSSHMILYIVDPSGVHGIKQDDGAGADGNPATSIPDTLLGPLSGPLDFTSFAAATGGAVFAERNDLDREMQEGLDAASTYYSLSYSPTNASDSEIKYRKIRVLLKDKTMHAVTREGYFAGVQQVEQVKVAGKQNSGQVKWDMATAAQTELDYDGLDVRPKEKESGYELDVVAKDLAWKEQGDGSRIAEVTVMMVYYDAKGKQISHQAKEMKEKLSMADDIGTGKRCGFLIASSTPSKATRVRFVVRDANNGKMGSANLALK